MNVVPGVFVGLQGSEWRVWARAKMRYRSDSDCREHREVVGLPCSVVAKGWKEGML